MPDPAQEFHAAYDALLARWPAGTAEVDVATPYGSTRVHAYGPEDATPLLLLHGGGATGTVWYGQAAELGRCHRVLAVDILGEAGRGVPDGRPLRTTADLMGWLDALLDGLGVARVRLLGHSYGAWVALTYALHAPERTDRLVLLDPTQCFAGFRPAFLLRALPMLVRPTVPRALALLSRETAGTGVDPQWTRLYALAVAAFPGRRPVTGRRPDPTALRCPLLVLLAGRSGTHDAGKVAARARAAVPHADVEILTGSSHFSLPTALPPATTRRITDFLGAEDRTASA
ncbi:alpha/beta fold hydrolase [Streptantibioticus cattleyicolor]|uniref:Carboxylesterase n=1 Tax=Streptantibioticus cattleyicolor (strain ATCC 35852 / DSM 46488 / JCM 4925 / NBRC 14057 / NRRL 8057) TaxID=1003195 RepID=F8JM53_STREN|nr:alpha/beta fold hydrolase [Streptantibioticus cattleyicolor]AEW99423.1 carboxylesterase [Streptantibioticus cattleyicolor NRRL 8057 = DSM 46488]CCB71537.1 putative carboxylesterase [Streptantibioticus cattleyicolor NRRL 8057 = DSM 46488]